MWFPTLAIRIIGCVLFLIQVLNARPQRAEDIAPAVLPAPPVIVPVTDSRDCVVVLDCSDGLVKRPGEFQNACWSVSHLLDAVPEGTRFALILMTRANTPEGQSAVILARALAPINWKEKMGLQRNLWVSFGSERRGRS
jgi:hypothetical protein